MKVEAFNSKFPNELKTVEIDVDKRIFKVNGEDFGDGCSEFSIHCEAGEGFKVYMQITSTLEFKSYDMSGNAVE